jgi:hypothetical protein
MHIAELFNAYFTEVAEWLQSNITPGVPKYSNKKQKLATSIFFTPTYYNEIITIIKSLKNNQVD